MSDVVSASSEIAALKVQINSIQSRVWYLRNFLIVSFAIPVIGFLLMISGHFPLIQARYIGVTDSSGEARIILGAQNDGNPAISLWDEKKVPRCGLVITKDGVGITILDKNGRERVMMEAQDKSDGFLGVAILDSEGREVKVLDAKMSSKGSDVSHELRRLFFESAAKAAEALLPATP